MRGCEFMCLICFEFNKKRMTIEEVKRALPEMITFAKSEDEKAHFKKLQSATNQEELEEETKKHTDSNLKK